MTSAPPNIAETSDNASLLSAPVEPRVEAAAGDLSPADDVVRSRRRGMELENAIRAACMAELAEVGYGSLTIESVASRAQTGKASIYRRWPTKQELVLDSVNCVMAGPMMRLGDRNYGDDVSTRDALLELLLDVSAVMMGPEGDAMRSVMSESLRDESFSISFQCDFYDPRKQALFDVLQRGINRGEVREAALDDFMPEMIAGMLIHRILLLRQRPTKAELERVLDAFVMPAIGA
ncbi:TetR/AcrR family transcriptional regulator [Jatrophihabitans sp. DSM 45814]